MRQFGKVNKLIYNLIMETIRTIIIELWSWLVKTEAQKYSVTFAWLPRNNTWVQLNFVVFTTPKESAYWFFSENHIFAYCDNICYGIVVSNIKYSKWQIKVRNETIDIANEIMKYIMVTFTSCVCIWQLIY